MKRFTDSPFEAQLEVVATIADRHVEDALKRLRDEDEMTLALRQSLREGVDINDLSDATGLPVGEIKRRTQGSLHVLTDVAELTGAR